MENTISFFICVLKILPAISFTQIFTFLYGLFYNITKFKKLLIDRIDVKHYYMV